MRLRGKLISGLGQGKFFLSLAPYQQGFAKVLGYEPFGGTLNLEVLESDAVRMHMLKNESRFEVPGFKLNGREYYQIRLVRARVHDVAGVVIFPLLNHHPATVLEFVTKENMREKFKLKDGDELEIMIC